MDRSELGQVVDRATLRASDGPRARLRIELPAAWMDAGAEVSVAAPARLTCDRCEGGGCDACGRSGVLRAPADPSARSVRLCVPAGSGAGVALRIVQPFGGGAPIEQLLVEVRPGAAPSPGVTRLPPSVARLHQHGRPSLGRASGVALAVLALAAAAVAALLSRG